MSVFCRPDIQAEFLAISDRMFFHPMMGNLCFLCFMSCFVSCQVGEEGAGHFVKMVHNGIEYGDMQVSLAEFEKSFLSLSI